MIVHTGDKVRPYTEGHASRPQFLDSEREIGTTQIDRASVHRVARSATLL